jgi:hypothetical protein
MPDFLSPFGPNHPDTIAPIITLLVTIIGGAWALFMFWFLYLRNTDKRKLIAFLDSLKNKGVLTNNYGWEDRKGTYISLDNIRKEILDTLNAISANSKARSSLQQMQNECRLAIQDPAIFPLGPNTPGGPLTTAMKNRIQNIRNVFRLCEAQIRSIL